MKDKTKPRAPHRYRLRLIELMGGKCAVCGFDRYTAALQFHHAHPDQKADSVSMLINAAAWKRIVHEAKKCVLLCANCHCAHHLGQLEGVDLTSFLGKYDDVLNKEDRAIQVRVKAQEQRRENRKRGVRMSPEEQQALIAELPKLLQRVPMVI